MEYVHVGFDLVNICMGIIAWYSEQVTSYTVKESLFAALVTDGQTYILNHLELRQREKLTNMKGMKPCEV